MATSLERSGPFNPLSTIERACFEVLVLDSDAWHTELAYMPVRARPRFMLSNISRIHLFQLITGKSARPGIADASTFRRLMSLISYWTVLSCVELGGAWD